MAPGSLLTLPLEIRLEIYGLVFGSGRVIIEAQDENDTGCLLPRNGTLQSHSDRSSQLLRVNHTILTEARPVLYANTVFHVLNQVFAGRLPIRLTDGHPCSPHVKHLVWQLDCDMLMHSYPEDLRLDLVEAGQWSSLEIRCRAETWRDSFLGKWCDRQAFVKGRDQVLGYARVFYDAMRRHHGTRITFVEDRSQLGRGRVMLRIASKESRLNNESLIIAAS